MVECVSLPYELELHPNGPVEATDTNWNSFPVCFGRLNTVVPLRLRKR